MRTVMAGEPHPPPPGRDLEKGVGCGLWAGGWAGGVRRFAMPDEEEEGVERNARAVRSRAEGGSDT